MQESDIVTTEAEQVRRRLFSSFLHSEPYPLDEKTPTIAD